MSFTTDKQTIEDLAIFSGRGKQSVYGIFNHTKTVGGSQLLEQFFKYPLSDEVTINQRVNVIRYLEKLELTFPVKAESVDVAEQYLSNTDSRNRLSSENDNLQQKFRNFVGSNTQEKLLIKGIDGVIDIFHSMREFLDGLPMRTAGVFTESFAAINQIIIAKEFEPVLLCKPGQNISFSQLAVLDKLLRFSHLEQLKRLFDHIYHLDVYITVARIAGTRKFAYAKAEPKGHNLVEIRGVYHPFLKEPVPNSLIMGHRRNVVFLTGANMAGKSTFLKSVGTALYLAHMGFPIPCEGMRFSVLDGMLTTINLSDNVSMGYSHFYAEVLRVKKMAEMVMRSMHVLIIFDELFRGTNVKDAYDATVAITDAMASKSNAMFMVSTHIMEAGETLKEMHSNISFCFLPTGMEGNRPVYTYALEEGISDDRHGMVIIKNEGILESLKKGVPTLK